MATKRQQAWAKAAEENQGMAAGLFSLLAMPNHEERKAELLRTTGKDHVCVEHTLGFSRNGRRGFKCGICKDVIKWVDQPKKED